MNIFQILAAGKSGKLYRARASAKTATTAIRLSLESIARKDKCRPSQIAVINVGIEHGASRKTTTERVIQLLP